MGSVGTINGVPWTPPPPGLYRGGSARGSHRLALALKCDTKWFLSYGMTHRRRERRGSLYAPIGTCVHTRAEFDNHLKKASPPAWALGDPEDEIRSEFAGHDDLDLLLDLSRDMWDAVKETELQQELQPIWVEPTVWATLGEIDPDCPKELQDEIVTSRLDILIKMDERRLLIEDFKTCGKGHNGRVLPKFDAKMPRWSMHPQAALATRIARERYTFPVFGFAIRRVSREKPHASDRRLLHVNENFYRNIGAWATAAVQREQEILRRSRERLPILQTGGATGECEAWGGCPALGFCHAAASRRPHVLERDFYKMGD